jgi:hypothetical protein
LNRLGVSLPSCFPGLTSRHRASFPTSNTTQSYQTRVRRFPLQPTFESLLFGTSKAGLFNKTVHLLDITASRSMPRHGGTAKPGARSNSGSAPPPALGPSTSVNPSEPRKDMVNFRLNMVDIGLPNHSKERDQLHFMHHVHIPDPGKKTPSLKLSAACRTFATTCPSRASDAGLTWDAIRKTWTIFIQ